MCGGLTPRALLLVGERHPSNFETLRTLSGTERCYEVPMFDDLTPAALDAWLDGNDLSELFDV